MQLFLMNITFDSLTHLPGNDVELSRCIADEDRTVAQLLQQRKVFVILSTVDKKRQELLHGKYQATERIFCKCRK